jgi:hypothetical protein
MPDLPDLDFTTAGPGPVFVEALTGPGRRFLGGPRLWCESPGTAKRTCIDAMLDGLTCHVDGQPVELVEA